MLPYNNTGKYHETPEGIPMLHTIDHSLTETMFSLSPSSQFMYEPEGIESGTCGQSQGFAGPRGLDMTSRDDCIKSEGIISPSMEGMTFQDCVELDGLFGPPTEGLGFKDCFELDGNYGPSVSGMTFEGTHDKPDEMFCMEFDDCGKMEQVYQTPREGVSFTDGGKANGSGFDVLSEALSFENCSKLNDLIPATTTTSNAEALDGLSNDWFKLEKDIFEMSKDNDELMQDPVFGGGPTLTQLNSKDLDSAFLDEYKILEDLYASSAAFTNVDQNAPVTSLEPVLTVSSKFAPGTPGIGSATVPKFTTCTITSYVTTVSTSGMAQPLRFPAFVTSDLLSTAGPEPCYLGSSPPERKPEIGMRDRLAELISSGVPMASTYANQCYVPMLTGGTQAVRLVGTVVVPAVSVMVPEGAPPKQTTLVLPESSPDEVKSVKRSLEQNWEMERYIMPAESRATAAIGSAEFSQGGKSQDVAFNPSEELLSDREESMLGDSDIENAEFDNSDEESVHSKSEHPDDYTPSSRKEKKYFWQYNTQSKGPKGKRLCKSVETEDPHVLHDFEDPVFDPEQNQTRYKHNGKARRGDGNDVTPNPHKLFVTGNELKKLNKLINDITPSSDMPASARSKMLKEKNKFASRACRLKKKAQHEANKLKLHGLELEHRQLMKVLGTIKREVFQRVHKKDGLAKESLSNKLESLVQQIITLNVAGHTADYVNLVLQKVAKGDRTGGVTVDD